MDSSDLSDGAVTLQEYLELKKALATSEAKVQQLMKVNSSLSDELRRLQREVRAAPSVPVRGLQEPCWRRITPSQRQGCPLDPPGFLTPLWTFRSTSCRQRTCRSGSRQGRCPHPHSPVNGQNTRPWGLAGVPTAGTARPSPCMNQVLP